MLQLVFLLLIVTATGRAPGAQAAITLPPQGCPSQTISGLDLSTTNPPTVTNVSFNSVNNHLVLTVASDVYWNGVETLYRTLNFSIGDVLGTPDQSGNACYTDGQTVTYEVVGDACRMVVTFSSAWTYVAPNCGFIYAASSDGMSMQASSLAYIGWTDTVLVADGSYKTRYLTDSQAINVAIPNYIYGQSNFAAPDSGRSSFFVSQMVFSTLQDGSKRLTLDYSVTINWPYVYVLNAANAPGGISLLQPQGLPAPVYDPATCDVQFNQGTCSQTASIIFTVPGDLCNLQGTYTIAFATSCNDQSCSADSDSFDITVGNYPVCTSLNQSLAGVTGTMASSSSTFDVGHPVNIVVNFASPNLKFQTAQIMLIALESTKYVSGANPDASWGNRTLCSVCHTNPPTSGLGLNIGLANNWTNGLWAKTYTGGSNAGAINVTFNVTSNSDPTKGVIKPTDIGTAGNLFVFYVRVRLLFDSAMAAAAAPGKKQIRRRRRLEYIKADIEEEVEAVLSEERMIDLWVRSKSGDLLPQKQVSFVNKAPTKQKQVKVASGKEQTYSVKFFVGPAGDLGVPANAGSGAGTGGNSGSNPATQPEAPPANLSTPPSTTSKSSGASLSVIIGAVIGTLCLVGGIAGIVAWGLVLRKRKKLAAAKTQSQPGLGLESSDNRKMTSVSRTFPDREATATPITTPTPSVARDASEISLTPSSVPDSPTIAVAIPEPIAPKPTLKREKTSSSRTAVVQAMDSTLSLKKKPDFNAKVDEPQRKEQTQSKLPKPVPQTDRQLRELHDEIVGYYGVDETIGQDEHGIVGYYTDV